MASERDRLEALYTFARGHELADRPVQGAFDAAHLREINRRLFQDMPGLGYNDVVPGEYRPPVKGNHDWYKNRSLEGRVENSVVAYSRMDGGAQREIDQTLVAADPARLRQLNTADFTETIADLYTGLDYLYPFPDGNSRTLRAFTRQLANESRFDLDWSRFNASEGGRNIVYVARDLSVNRLAIDRVSSDETRRRVTFTLDQFEGNRDLGDLLTDAVRPHRAIAFEELDREEALAEFPELSSAYAVLRAAGQYALAKMPGAQRQQFDAAIQEKIQMRLDAGEPIESKIGVATRGASTPDNDIER